MDSDSATPCYPRVLRHLQKDPSNLRACDALSTYTKGRMGLSTRPHHLGIALPWGCVSLCLVSRLWFCMFPGRSPSYLPYLFGTDCHACSICPSRSASLLNLFGIASFCVSAPHLLKAEFSDYQVAWSAGPIPLSSLRRGPG